MKFLYIILLIFIICLCYKRKELYQNYKYKLPESYAFPYYNYTKKSYSNYYEHPYYNLNRFHDQYYPRDIPEFDD